MMLSNYKSSIHYFLSLVSLLLITGCVNTNDTDDLIRWTQDVLARPGGIIDPLPEIKPYEAYKYKSAELGLKDPFEPFYQETARTETETVADTGLNAEMEKEIKERNREELEQYELDSLRMVGTIDNEDNNWGVILDPGGVVHRVSVGNYMGRNIGKIVNIFEDRIELREIVKSEQGRWEERQASIALVEQ